MTLRFSTSFSNDSRNRHWRDGSIPVLTRKCANNAERVNESIGCLDTGLASAHFYLLTHLLLRQGYWLHHCKSCSHSVCGYNPSPWHLVAFLSTFSKCRLIIPIYGLHFKSSLEPQLLFHHRGEVGHVRFHSGKMGKCW